MFNQVFIYLDLLQEILWGYIGVGLIVVFGLYFSIKSKFFQITQFPKIVKNFFYLFKKKQTDERGTHPIQVFLAAVGGCIGIGNIVTVCLAVQIGGPGAVFWIWVTSLLGMLLKYGEIFLGLKYRVKNKNGSYDGGPMQFLPKAYKCKWIAYVAAALLCLYGVEVFMFKVIVNNVTANFDISATAVTILLLLAIFFAGFGGVQRVAKISSILVPIFVILYLVMSIWVICHYLDAIPSAIKLIFSSAFTGHAAVGGFLGSTLMMAMSNGVAAGCYTGDIGVGYASVIHAETKEKDPVRQSSLAIMGIFLDTIIICTLTLLLILVTGIWSSDIDASILVQTALSMHFPYMHIFMPLLIFLLGYSTVIAYFVVGLKSARFLFPKMGTWIFSTYAAIAFVCVLFFEPKQALTIMFLSGGGLVSINLVATFLLRKEISFTFPKDY